MNKSYIILFRTLLLCLATLFVSCNEEETFSDEQIEIRPYTSISTTSVETRAAVKSNLPKYFTVGIGLFLHGSIFPTPTRNNYFEGYDNIRALVDSLNYAEPRVWRYQLQGSTLSTAKLGVFKRLGRFNVYAYSPHQPQVDGTNLHQIPFIVGRSDSTNFDYMVANPLNNLPDPASLASNAVINLPLTLNHLMTLISFRFKNSYVGPVRIRKIHLAFHDGTNPQNIIGMYGTFSPISGTLTPNPASFTDTLTIYYNRNIPTYNHTTKNYTDCHIMIPEVIVTDSDPTTLTATVYLEDKEQKLLSGSFTTPLNVFSANGKKGLQKGIEYRFNITIDNYIKFTNPPQIDTWTGATIHVKI